MLASPVITIANASLPNIETCFKHLEEKVQRNGHTAISILN